MFRLSTESLGSTSSNHNLLRAPQVRKRYGGISDMCLWRWLRDPKLDFPQPFIIRKRRYWHTSKLEAWEQLRLKTRHRRCNI
jgi:predicted DNA-binding transcriptional regulator AlpA